jgi:hypothetical protein
VTILATDPFTGTSDAALSGNWTGFSGGAPAFISLTLNGNEARNNGANVGAAYYSGITWPNDQYAEVVVGSVVSTATDEGLGPAVRMNAPAGNPTSFYFAQTNTTETKLYRWNNSTGFTQLGSDGAPCTTGDLLRITANGTSLTVTKNGATICGPATDATNGSGSAGIWGTPVSGPGTLNSFEGGDLLNGPTINTQPANVTVYLGQVATFTISATTSGGTLHYQWKDDASNVGTDSSTYAPTPALSDSGSLITCDVSDDNGTTTTSSALLTVLPSSKVSWIRA